MTRLADVLAVTPDFFQHEPGAAPPADTLHLRSRRRSPPKYVIRRLQAKAELFARVTQELNRHVEFPQVSFPDYSSTAPEWSRRTIRGAAAECRAMWGVPQDDPIHYLTRLLERAGALVGSFREEYGAIQAFCWWGWRPLVMVNQYCPDGRAPPVTRIRFDLAHETAHIVLHRGKATGDDVCERQANQFAADLLLPETPFRTEFSTHARRLDWELIFRMKRKWGVSAQAIVTRAHELALIDTRLFNRFWISLNKKGWRKREPCEPSLDESPEITRRVVEALEVKCDVTAWELAQAVALTTDDFTELTGVHVRPPSNVIPFRGRDRVRRSHDSTENSG